MTQDRKKPNRTSTPSPARSPVRPQGRRPLDEPRPSTARRDEHQGAAGPRPTAGRVAASAGRRGPRLGAVGSELVVEAVTLEHGEGIGRVEELAVRVPGLLPGERARVKVLEPRGRGVRATIVELEKASPHRVTPRCPHFERCGGCELQHLAHPEQLHIKTVRVRSALAEALGHGRVEVLPAKGAADPWAQRTRAAFQVGGEIGGLDACFFRAHTRSLVRIHQCPVQDPGANRIAMAVLAIASELRIPPWREREQKGTLRALLVRSAPGSGRYHVTLVAVHSRFAQLDVLVERTLALEGVDGASLNHNPEPGPQLLGSHTRPLGGHARLEDRVGDTRYVMSPSAFFQTSRYGVAALVEEVGSSIGDVGPSPVLFDLYCGVGLFSLALAPRFARVVGIEENGAAIEDARIGAKLNQVGNVDFLAGRVEDRLAQLPASLRSRPSVVVLDPPREGCAPQVLGVVVNDIEPRRIIYVACDVDSLARDAALLEGMDWELKRAQPVDMFPHTSHVEVVAVFEPRAGRTTRQERHDAEDAENRTLHTPGAPTVAQQRRRRSWRG